MGENYYEILGIDKNADEKAIKEAYRQKAKEHHPDVGGNEESFKKVNEAYSILSDPDKKSRYDRGGTGHDSFTYEDIMNMMNQNARKSNGKRAVKGSNIRISLKIKFNELFTGANKTIKLKREVICDTCNGSGGEEELCSRCNGSGMRIVVQKTNFGVFQSASPCTACGGFGYTLKTPCKDCSGEGTIKKDEIIDITIPPSINAGDGLLASNYGNYNKRLSSERFHNLPGDLIINVMIVGDKKFKRDGFSLKQHIELDYPDFILGSEIEVDTIEETKIKLNVPEFTKSGTILRVAGKGLYTDGSKTNRGDMYLELEVRIPSNIGEDEKELLKKLKKMLDNRK